MARRRRHKRGFGRFLKGLGKIAKVVMPFAKPFVKMAAGIIPGGGTVMAALEMGGKAGLFKGLGGAFKGGKFKIGRLAGAMIPGFGLAKQGLRLAQGKRVNFGELAGGLAPGLNETLALARQGRNLVQGKRVNFGEVLGAASGLPGGLSMSRFAGDLARRTTRGPMVARRGGRDSRAWAAFGRLGEVAGMSDDVASRALGISRWDLQRAKTFARRARDTGALSGLEYVVESGDNLSKIAQELVGNAGRWRELRDANPQKPVDPKTGNFRTLFANEHLNLPASWVAELGLSGATPAPGEVVQLPETTIYGDAPAPTMVPVSMPPDFTLPASLPAAVPVSMPPDFTLPALPTYPTVPVVPSLPDVVATTGTDVTPAGLPVEPAPAPPPAAPSSGPGLFAPLAMLATSWALGLI